MAHAIIAYKMDAWIDRGIDTSALSAATVSAASVGYSTLKDRQKEVLVNTSQDFNTCCLVSFYYTRHIALAS